MKNGSFFGKVYNETLRFDGTINEGWNFLTVQFYLDGTSAYTRIRVNAYSKAMLLSSVKTFSRKFIDDVDYDLIFGGHYANDGQSLIDGFAGYILEIRLLSTTILTLDQSDLLIQWDCNARPSVKFCEMCPGALSLGTANQCLEDTWKAGAYSKLSASY
jgi:hypothetical protein